MGDEAGGDDGLWSALGDGFGLADRVPFGLGVLDGLAQLAGVGVTVAEPLALTVAEVEVDVTAVAVPVAVVLELGLVLLPGAGGGLVLGLPLGLPLPGGVAGGLVGGGVDGLPDWLGLVGLCPAGVSVPDAAGLGVGQDEPGVGVRCPALVLVSPTPPPLGWPGLDPGELAEELVVPEPVTVAVSWPIE